MMSLEIFNYIRLFYHSIMVGTAMLCFFLLFSFWIKHRNKEHDLVNAILFASLIVISWIIPAIGHLLSLIWSDTEVLNSIFRVISLCNNLFIILFLPYLGYFESLKKPKNALNFILIFLLSMMFLFVIDGVSIKDIPIGARCLLWVDTGISLFALYFFSKGIYAYLKRSDNLTHIFSYLLLFSANLLACVVILSFVFAQFNLFHLPFVYQYFYFTYILHYISVFYFMLMLVLLCLDWDNVLVDLDETSPPTSIEALSYPPISNILPNTNSEILPQSLEINYDEVKKSFVLTLICNTKTYQWVGDNCIYPFFYWVYLSLALKKNIPVPIKDAQVNRNKMVSLLGKELKPKNFILLNGEEATLNLPIANIIIDEKVLHHQAVKSKFRELIKPFLYDQDIDYLRYKTDFQYADEIFQHLYQTFYNSNNTIKND